MRSRFARIQVRTHVPIGLTGMGEWLRRQASPTLWTLCPAFRHAPGGVTPPRYGRLMNADEGPRAGMVELELLGLSTACWKCGGSTVALVAVSPGGARGDDELFQTSEPAALAFASRTAGDAYLSNGSFPLRCPPRDRSFCFTRSCSRSSSPKGPRAFAFSPSSESA